MDAEALIGTPPRPDVTLRPSPATVAGATLLALGIGGLGFWMFYFGGIRSGAVVPLVLGPVVVLLAVWLETQMFGFVRLRDGDLTRTRLSADVRSCRFPRFPCLFRATSQRGEIAGSCPSDTPATPSRCTR